jgi:SpoVK/Ycf46/Vps4 family AAA+-type ATPase
MLLLPEARKGLAPFLLDAGILQRIGVKSASAQSHAEEEDLEIAHFTLAEVRRALSRNRCREPGFPEPLAGNLARFQSIFGLTRLEQNLIGFFVLLNKIEWFNECSQCLGHELGNLRICQILSHLLKAQTAEVKKALGSGGTLSRVGFLRFDSIEEGTLQSRIDLMDGFAELLSEDETTVDGFFGRFFRETPECRLTREDYPHVATDLDLLADLFRNARAQKTPGINVLLYGPPGSGKTELARLIGREAGLHLFEVSATDPDGDPYPGSKRLLLFKLCQQTLERHDHSALLLDEIEDVFPTDPDEGFHLNSNEMHKAWTNHLLETNPIPALWVSNVVDQIDPAFLRRFSHILQLGAPPAPIRERILADRVEGLGVSPSWIRRLARESACMPAHLDTAARTARLASRTGPEAERAMERVLTGLFSASGEKPLPRATADSPLPYRPDWLNPDLDLTTVQAAIRRNPAVRICLYGPPGTGKTAFGKHLAEILGLPHLPYRASDLLGSYVGESERNIADMFRTAEEAGALLQVDEADSFLRARSGAHYAWEMTQVNEFLVGLEHFRGTLVASTNLIEGLDPAVFRRFDLKVRLAPLTGAQRLEITNTVLADWGLPPLGGGEEAERRLATLSGLTPGDFQAALRALSLREERSAGALLSALAGERAHQPGNRARGIGFLAEWQP